MKGMIWEMNPDGSGFQAIKNFHIQKPLRPVGEMVMGSDGQGYGFAAGYDIDAGVQVFYQYNFTTKDLQILKVFPDAPFGPKLFLGADGVLYGTRRSSDTTRAVCKISLEGEVLADIHSFKFSGSITGMTQTPDGSIILTCEKYGEGPFLMGGFPDGSNWKTMVSFQYDPLGNYLSNLIPKSDGYLYGVTWEYSGVVLCLVTRSASRTLCLPRESTRCSGRRTAEQELDLLANLALRQYLHPVSSPH